MAFGNAGIERLVKAGRFDFQATGEVRHVKNSYVLFNLKCDKGNVTLSAGHSNGVGYDNITTTAKALKICSTELAAVNKAAPEKREGPLVKLAKAVFTYFKTSKKVKVITPKSNGKVIVSKSDGKPVVNLVEII